MYIVVASVAAGVSLQEIDGSGSVRSTETASLTGFASEVARREGAHPRWVWDDTERWYPQLLEAGVRVERCVDLRLCRAILRSSPQSAGTDVSSGPPDDWDAPPTDRSAAVRGSTLFDLEDAAGSQLGDPLVEFTRQRRVTTPSLALLLSLESAGALAAAEMRHMGLPWREDLHEELLTRTLGPRPRPGDRPARMEALARDIRLALNAPDLNPDSASSVLRALRRAGVTVDSTRKWELRRVEHPAVEPLLEYKQLARLYSANGWHWLEANVRGGRFRADYVPGGVVTGRWASRGGGGALQLPRQVRHAVRAEAGRRLVVADASQLEPRILAALSRDRGMVEAGAAGDLYAGIVASGAIATREQAKLAMLGAMYGATRGESGRLMPSLSRLYPRAIQLVESAARTGERGERVATLLGRGSPYPDEEWRDLQAAASMDGAGAAVAERARSAARAWGRFTRNFVVQGTAAEWALCWMATLRQRLYALGNPLDGGPALVFFLHDELVIDAPADAAEAVADVIRVAADEAGRLLFGELPIHFPLAVAVVESYAEAK